MLAGLVLIRSKDQFFYIINPEDMIIGHLKPESDQSELKPLQSMSYTQLVSLQGNVIM